MFNEWKIKWNGKYSFLLFSGVEISSRTEYLSSEFLAIFSAFADNCDAKKRYFNGKSSAYGLQKTSTALRKCIEMISHRLIINAMNLKF